MAPKPTHPHPDALTDEEQAQIDALFFEAHEIDPLDPTPDDDDPDEEFDLTEIRAYDEAAGRTVEAPTKKLTKEFATYLQTQRLLSIEKVCNIEPPRWFLHEVLPEAPLTILHGPGGTKKSFLMLDLALHADADMPWHGRPIRPGRTMYVLGEGISGVGKRINAWCAFHNVPRESLRSHFVAHPLDLFGWSKPNDKTGEFPVQVEAWRAMVEAMNFDYVIVDTLHRNAPGADENSSLDIGRVFAAAQRIAGRAHLFFVHHDPKEGKTARGSSSIHDDADVVVRIEEKDEHTSTLHSVKLRDAEDFKPIDLHFYKDTVFDSLVIDSTDQWKPKKSKRQQIIDTVRAEPGQLTISEIKCAVGDGKVTAAEFKKLVAADILYTEVRPRKKNSGPKFIDVYFVAEDKLAEDPDEEFDTTEMQ